MKKRINSNVNRKEEMDIVFILDRSGSMAGIENDTIGGYNSYLEQQKNNNVKVTTVLFDDNYEILNIRKEIQNVSKLTNEEYYVRGCTALYDAIGRTIKTIEASDYKKVMFVITTDGYENASKEYKKAQIKEMIKSHKDWEFIYIGADVDSYAEGTSIGIESKNISNYRKDKKGVSKLFNSISRASDMLSNEKYLDASWKEDLENYIEKNHTN